MRKPMDIQTLQGLCQQLPWSLDAGDREGLTVITGPVRLRYVNFVEPTSPPGTNKEPRFNCLALIPDMANWQVLIDAATRAWATSQWANQRQGREWWKAQNAFVDETGKLKEGFGAASFGAQSYAINTETKEQPPFYAIYADPANPNLPARVPVQNAYPGMWARLRVRAQAYNVGGNSGVKFWLQSCQHIADDVEIQGFDRAAGYTPLAPAGAAPAQMPGAFGARAQAAAPRMPAAGGFGGPAATQAPMAPQQYAAPQAPQQAPQQYGAPTAPQMSAPSGFGQPNMPVQAPAPSFGGPQMPGQQPAYAPQAPQGYAALNANVPGYPQQPAMPAPGGWPAR